MISMTHGATKGHTDAWDLGCTLWPYWYPKAVLSVSEAMVSSELGMLLTAMSGSVGLQQPRSVLMSVVPDTTEGNADARDLDCHLWPCWYLRALLPWRPG